MKAPQAAYHNELASPIEWARVLREARQLRQTRSMSATTRDVIDESSEASLQVDAEHDELTDPTEDLANEATSELNPVARIPKPTSSAPIGHGIAEIEPIGRMPMVSIGTVLRERYVLERQLANGGTSLVFRAHDLRRDPLTAGGPRVAVKVLRPELRHRPHHVARLQREYRQTQALPHPGVVRFHDLDCDRDIWFIVMELLTGETLGPRLRRSAPAAMPIAEIAGIASAAGDVLEFAHQRGVVHGDVKPDNIFVTTAGAVRLLDFGVAPELAVIAAGASVSGETVGAAATRAYASPEVLAGERPVPADDVFSLACVIYEMAAGRHPWGRRGSDQARNEQLSLEWPRALATSQWAAVSAALSWNRSTRPALRDLIGALRVDASEPVAVPADIAVTAESPVVAANAVAKRAGRWRSEVTMGAIGLAFLLGLVLSRVAVEPVESPQVATTIPSEAAIAPAAQFAAPLTEEFDPVPEAFAAPAFEVVTPPPETQTVAMPPAGFVAFEYEQMSVSSKALVAAIPVRHFTDGPRVVEVGWRVLEGSAVAGRDIGGPQSGVARFTEGHTFRVIYVPITIDTSTVGERTFAVELTDASADAALGAMRRVIVTIVDDA
jgi:Protein kinase domain